MQVKGWKKDVPFLIEMQTTERHAMHQWSPSDESEKISNTDFVQARHASAQSVSQKRGPNLAYLDRAWTLVSNPLLLQFPSLLQ